MYALKIVDLLIVCLNTILDWTPTHIHTNTQHKYKHFTYIHGIHHSSTHLTFKQQKASKRVILIIAQGRNRHFVCVVFQSNDWPEICYAPVVLHSLSCSESNNDTVVQTNQLCSQGTHIFKCILDEKWNAKRKIYAKNLLK